MKLRVLIFWLVSFLIMLRGIFSLFGLETLSKLLAEGLIVIWVFAEFSKGGLRFVKVGFYGAAFYFLWVVIVACVNDDIPEIYLYLRYCLLGQLLLYAIYVVGSNADFQKRMVIYIDWIVVSQIIASVILFFAVGRLEKNVGTMSSSGGSLATVWPLTFAPYYFFRYLQTGNLKYLGFVLGLVFIGFASGKRAVYFLIPVTILLMNLFFVHRSAKKGLTYFKRIALSFAILFIGLLAGISKTESLSESHGFSLKSVGTAFSYVEEYSSAESALDGNAIGRSSSTRNTFKSLLKDDNALFGNGLGVLKGEISYSEYGVGYGITGLLRESISLGIFGGVAYLSLYFSLLFGLWRMRTYVHCQAVNSEKFLMWYLSVSGLIAILITTIGYSRAFSQSFTPLFFIMIAVGISLSRHTEKYPPINSKRINGLGRHEL